jgi:hypothetical protein
MCCSSCLHICSWISSPKDLCWGWLNTEERVSEVAAGISVCWFWSWTDPKTDKEWRVVVLAWQLAWYEWFQCFQVPPKNQSVRSCGLWGIELKTGIAVTGGSQSKSIKQASKTLLNSHYKPKSANSTKLDIIYSQPRSWRKLSLLKDRQTLYWVPAPNLSTLSFSCSLKPWCSSTFSIWDPIITFPWCNFFWSLVKPPKKRKWTQPSGKKDAAANFRAFFNWNQCQQKLWWGLDLEIFPLTIVINITIFLSCCDQSYY